MKAVLRYLCWWQVCTCWLGGQAALFSLLEKNQNCSTEKNVHLDSVSSVSLYACVDLCIQHKSCKYFGFNFAQQRCLMGAVCDRAAFQTYPIVYSINRSYTDNWILSEMTGELGRCTLPLPLMSRNNSIVWDSRFVWSDPGPKTCPFVKNIDAGVCVRTHPIHAHAADTRDVRCLPSFVILGVQKAGTRELRNWLHMHPNLLGASAELGYLNSRGCEHTTKRRAHIIQKKNTDHLCTHPHNPTSNLTLEKQFFWRGYLDHFPPMTSWQVRTQYTFEKTPNYFEMPLERITRLQNYFPSIKLLLILRDPVTRIYSWFNMCCNTTSTTIGTKGFVEILEGRYRGQIWGVHAFPSSTRLLVGDMKVLWRRASCSPETFEKFILLKEYSTDDVVIPWERIQAGPKSGVADALRRGQYASRLSLWFQVFPRRQFHIMTMDDTLQKPCDTMHEIERFLGIPRYNFEKHVRHITMPNGKTTVVMEGSGQSKALHQQKATVQDMTTRSRRALERFYAPWNSELSKLLKHPLFWKYE
eukprot:m.254472 g.254472  ORF g.254472 m.254472 type:complete len:528 (-) comp16172_c0_seq1:46-1629(-)